MHVVYCGSVAHGAFPVAHFRDKHYMTARSGTIIIQLFRLSLSLSLLIMLPDVVTFDFLICSCCIYDFHRPNE